MTAYSNSFPFTLHVASSFLTTHFKRFSVEVSISQRGNVEQTSFLKMLASLLNKWLES